MSKSAMGCCALVLVLAAGVLVGCGGKDDEAERSREGMPFYRVKLRNMSPPDGPPAEATASGTSNGRPSQSHSVPPVPPGGEGSSSGKGTDPADGVAITVVVGAMTLTGSGEWPGSSIDEVEIDVDPGGGQAVVKFHLGQPDQTIPLAP